MWDVSGRHLESSSPGSGAKATSHDAGTLRFYSHVGTSLPARFADQFAPWTACGESSVTSSHLSSMQCGRDEAP